MGFIPIGEKSRRQLVVELIAPLNADDVVTFDQIAEEIGLTWPKDKELIRSTVHTARAALANDHHKALAAVRNVGYRVIRPEEHIQVAAQLQRKSGRTLALARTTVDSVDLAGLTEDGRKLAMAASAVLAWQQEQIRRLDLRQKGIEKVLGSVTEKVDEVTAATTEHRGRLAELEARLAALETGE